MKVASAKRTLLWDPYNDPNQGDAMQFRLTYAGPLLASGNRSRGNTVNHKHDLRMHFHRQLERLWDITPHLKNGGGTWTSVRWYPTNEDTPKGYKPSYLANKFAMYGCRFVPLVRKEADLLCGIDVLFLRPSRPGAVIKSGDIDGRLKTLLDALSLPDGNQDYESRTVRHPIFVLLEDDSLVTKLSVETDQMLELSSSAQNYNDVRLVLTVTVRPYEMTDENLQYG